MELVNVSHRRPRRSRILSTGLSNARQREAIQPEELQLIKLLQLLGHYKVRSFFIERSREWNSERYEQNRILLLYVIISLSCAVAELL